MQHSLAMIESCTFEDEHAVRGYGGSISGEHVGNISIKNCVFKNCRAKSGGSVSVRTESVLVVKHCIFDNSFSTFSGGAFFISARSYMVSHNTTVKYSQSISGAGIFVSDSSEIVLQDFYFARNTVKTSGAAILCQKSKNSL